VIEPNRTTTAVTKDEIRMATSLMVFENRRCTLSPTRISIHDYVALQGVSRTNSEIG
jgi:hypothetical protein